jgi:hypothetical protein
MMQILRLAKGEVEVFVSFVLDFGTQDPAVLHSMSESSSSYGKVAVTISILVDVMMAAPWIGIICQAFGAGTCSTPWRGILNI